MEEDIQDVAEDIDSEVKEDTNISEEPVEEDTEATKVKLEEALKAKSELTARAKKAEEELKILKAKPQESKPNNPQLSEELKLIARGLSDELIEEAKMIAKGKDISLTDAIKDPTFILIKNNFEEEEKKEKAKLGASKGSGEAPEGDQTKGTESGATRDEHKEAFKKALDK